MTSILILQHQRPDGEVDTYHLKAGRRYHIGRGSQCQVRVLDLKLSRQHCAVEHGPDGWQLVDLASTNGCAVDGIRVAGASPLKVGSEITAGTTRLTVGAIHAADQPPPVLGVPPESADPGAPPEQLESGPTQPSERLAAAAARAADASDELEPQPSPSRSTISDPLIPGVPATTANPQPAAPSEPDLAPVVDHDVLATMTPGTQPPPGSEPHPADSGSRSYYINLLGRRVGPLTRSQARDLKARELKGSLTQADLADFEAAAEVAAIQPEPKPAAQPVAAAAGDEVRTYYITLLGQRVGPLSRSQARELKARELKGQLAPADIAHLLS